MALVERQNGRPASAAATPAEHDGEASPIALATFWQANLAGWLFVALFGVISRAVFYGDLRVAVLVTAIMDSIGYGLTCLAHVLIRKYLRWPVTALRVVPIALAFAVLGGLLQMLVVGLLRQGLFTEGYFGQAFGGPFIAAIYYTSVFLGWALAYFWLSTDFEARAERVRRSEAQSAAARAELQQLRVQLDPHFLFNALNTVTAEIPDRPQVALEMTRRIAAYMRYCLDNQGRSVCWLADELDAVKSYLRIQALRYDERLVCSVEADADAGSFPVPHLILQGLVENAVKHGLKPSSETPLHIRVTALRQGDRLSVAVTNSGRHAPIDRERPGLGLANIRRRLELHFPGRHHLSVAQEGDLVAARLTVQGPICYA
ncbi:sensor histidine kinase [Chelatococcus reniformis]|uniref:Sensor histidine kinase n=1 Tax=Chelatococcus reniformis TaxID=1494448 RepID=A0A916U9K2_9HYPH|nr:histidine kinase [Chelatococcus reniformis]GGC64862.1 sensor histidine kinase [Chelatococcus reniformis]